MFVFIKEMKRFEVRVVCVTGCHGNFSKSTAWMNPAKTGHVFLLVTSHEKLCFP